MKGKRRNPNNLYRYSPPFQEVKRSYILPWVWTKLCDLLSKNGMLERGTITLPWKIPVNTTLARWLMLAPPVMIHVDSTNPLIWWWKRHPSLYLFFPKHYNPNLIIKKNVKQTHVERHFTKHSTSTTQNSQDREKQRKTKKL